MFYLTLVFLFQFHHAYCQPSINHGFLKHLIPVKPINPTDVHRQGYFLPSQSNMAKQVHLIPFHPQQQQPQTLNPPYRPQFINEIWSHQQMPVIPSPFQTPLGQQAVLGTNYPSSAMYQNSLNHNGIVETKPHFLDTSNTEFLNFGLNKTLITRPLALLITGKSEKGKGLLRDVLLHVDLDESVIRALKPHVLEELNLFSPNESKWYRMMAERVLKRFKSRYNLVFVPKPPTIIDLFERREEKIWNEQNSDIFRIDIQDIINPRK